MQLFLKKKQKQKQKNEGRDVSSSETGTQVDWPNGPDF